MNALTETAQRVKALPTNKKARLAGLVATSLALNGFLALVAVVVFLVAGCSRQGSPAEATPVATAEKVTVSKPETQPPTSKPEPLAALPTEPVALGKLVEKSFHPSELYHEYRTNERTADEKYRDKVVSLTRPLIKKFGDGKGRLIVQVVAVGANINGGGNIDDEILCYFPNMKEKELQEFLYGGKRKGDYAIIGRIGKRDRSGSPVLEDCRIVEQNKK